MAHWRLGQPLRGRRPARQRHHHVRHEPEPSAALCGVPKQGRVEHGASREGPDFVCGAAVRYRVWGYAVGYSEVSFGDSGERVAGG